MKRISKQLIKNGVIVKISKVQLIRIGGMVKSSQR